MINNTLNRVAPGITEELASAGQELLKDTKLAPNPPTIINQQPVIGAPNNNADVASDLRNRLSKI